MRSLWLSHLTSLILLGVGTGVVASAAWLSLQALINPDVTFWLNQYFPHTAPRTVAADARPLTLKQIQANIQRSGLTSGQPLVLTSDLSFSAQFKGGTDILIPVGKNIANCNSNCYQITELQVYRSLQIPYLLRVLQGKHYFRLLDRTVVTGPDEAEIIDLINPPTLADESRRKMPLNVLGEYNPAPTPGTWLRLTGLTNSGSATVTYGQIFYFNADSARLTLMLNWISPTGNIPNWEHVTGGRFPELVIDQSAGLDPQYSVYQINSAANGGMQLHAISLAEPAFADPAFTQSLNLARSGLWFQALQILKQVKQTQPQRWSKAAQAQFDYIELHARITLGQADQPSINPEQRVLAYLMNGSWTPAIQTFQASSAARKEIRQLLLSDSGRLLSRIETALELDPGQPDAIAWGAMTMMLKKSPPAAIAWMRQRGASASVIARTQKLMLQLEDLDKIPPKKAAEPTSKPNSASNSKPEPVPSLPTPAATAVSPPPQPQIATPATPTPTATPAAPIPAEQ